MSDALLAGVSGLKAHQKMIDVAGHNLANVDTAAFKSSRVSFSEMLNETLREASQSSASVGGVNPMQIGSGVTLGAVSRNMTQGALIDTGQPLDMAIEGAGYFTLNDGTRDLYTRVGQFAVDSDYYLVDPATGYRVQRMGSEGVDVGFQSIASTAIRIPYDVALQAKETSRISYVGNLSADDYNPTMNVLASPLQYTVDEAVANNDHHLDELDQMTGLAATDTLTVHGFKRDGAELGGGAGVEIALHDGTDYLTLGELMTAVTNAYKIGGEEVSAASIENGQIYLTDAEAGYSKTDISLAYNGSGGFGLPDYFKVNSAGGLAGKTTNITIYDSQGIAHSLSADFVRTDAPNTWDLVMTSLSGDVQLVDRRVAGIGFLADGSFGGVQGTDMASFRVTFLNDPTNPRTISLDLGTIGDTDGLSQFGNTSTVAPSSQDGYPAGWLSSLSVTSGGVLVGVFTNGVREEVAALKLASFQNSAGLSNVGANYWEPTANSGDPVPTKATEGGAGSIHGSAVEKSNVEMAVEFVNLIQAQNGYQASARTIRVATDILRELTNLIR